MAAKAEATHRTVVLLRAAEKKHLTKLAREQRVSASEIIRRSLHAYEPAPQQLNEAELSALMTEMNAALDQALENVRSARVEVAGNIAKMRRLRKQQA